MGQSCPKQYVQRGFHKLFGTTVFRYVSDKRMEWAEQLLRQGNI
jgi:AraC-like DNA-binding protein